MRFHLRNLFAFTFLAALGLLAWNARRGVEQSEQRREQVDEEIQSLQRSLGLDRHGPALVEAKLHMVDHRDALRKLREKAIEQVQRMVLYDSPVSIEPPDDPKAVSLRSLWSDGFLAYPLSYERAPIYRVTVPTGRAVWLKFAVHQPREHAEESSIPENLDGHHGRILDKSPLRQSGPYEMRLPEGEQALLLQTGIRNRLAPAVSVALNESL